MYAAAQGSTAGAEGAQGEPGAAGADGGAPKQDNVVEADYEIVDDDKSKKA
jgi:molecular chaperone DnaK